MYFHNYISKKGDIGMAQDIEKKELIENIIRIYKEKWNKEYIDWLHNDILMLVGFKMDMEKLGVDVFALEVEDRKSARTSHKDSYTPAIMLYILTLVVAAIAFALFNFEIPQENKSTLYMVVGQILTAWIGAVAYWYGTTKGSSDKNKLMNREFK